MEYASSTETTNAAPEARLATVPTTFSLKFLPKMALMSKPVIGAKTSHGARKKNPVLTDSLKCINFSEYLVIARRALSPTKQSPAY
jgi:hypothetical protein